MKRDMDLAREILLLTEESVENPLAWVNLEIEGRSLQELSYHVVILEEAGLLVAQDLCHIGADGYDWKPKRLTWFGHEFLDTIREKDIWDQTKAGAKAAGGFSIDILTALAKGLIRKQIEKHTGIEIDI